MQVISLQLENVKSYAQATIDFTLGTNAIVGQNGAGKSTILEAIGFALFDALAYRQSDFVREGEKTATITVKFLSSHDERVYEVIRKCGSSSVYYVFDPELDLRVCEGKVDVQRFLRLHLGADQGANLERLFSDAVGVSQGTFTAAFQLRPAERKSIFDPLLQVDEYDTAWTRLREPGSLLRQQRHDLDVEIGKLEGRLEQLPTLQAAVDARIQEVKNAQADLATTGEQRDAALAQRAALDHAHQQLTELQQHHRQAEMQLSGLRDQQRAADRAHAEAAHAVEIVAQFQPGQRAYLAAQEAQKVLDGQVRERQQLRDQRAALDKSLSLLDAQQQQSQKQLADIAQAEATVAQLQAAVARQEAIDAELAAVRTAISTRQAAQDDLSRRQTEADALRQRHATLVQALENAAALETAQREMEENIKARQAAIAEARDEQTILRARADGLKQQSELIEASDSPSCPVCEQPLTDEHRQELLTRNADQLTDLRNRYKAAQAQVNTQESQLQEEQSQLKQLADRLRRLPRVQEVDEVSRSVDAVAVIVADLQAKVDDLAAAPEQAATLESQLAALDDPRGRMAVAQAAATRRAQVEQEQQSQAAQVAAAQEALAQVDEQLGGFAQLDEQVERNQAALAEHVEAHQTVLAHQQLAESHAARQADADRLAELVAAAETSATELAGAVEQAQAAFDPADHARVKQAEQELTNRHTALQTQIQMLQATQARDQEAVTALQQVQRELENKAQQRKTVDEQEKILTDMRSALKQAGPFITQTLIRRISDEAAQLFGEIMQDHTRHLAWNEEYAIMLNVDGNERQFAQLSGGEQMSAALAVRLALLRSMSNIDIAFFDEPTTNLDTTRRESLAQQILTVDGLRQIFVISHDDTFEQATDNVIRVARTGGASSVG